MTETMDYGFQLQEVDLAINKELTALKDKTKDWEFTIINQFVLSGDTGEICGIQQKYPGVYLFEMLIENSTVEAAVWKENFSSLWKDPTYHKQFVPGVKKKRLNAHSDLKQWMPLYIGKSRNVGKRINEHLLLDILKTTFAMKLKARINLYGETFRVSSIKIQVKNYDAIMPIIESALRNKLQPIIGKQ